MFEELYEMSSIEARYGHQSRGNFKILLNNKMKELLGREYRGFH